MKRGIEFELSGGACSLLTAMLRLPALHNMSAICTEYEAVTNQGNLELPSMVSAETLAALNIGEKDKEDGRRVFSVV